MADLDYTVEERENARVVHLSGSITSMTAESLEQICRYHSERDSVILDMSQIRLVTSAGMTALVNASIEAREHKNRLLLLEAGADFHKLAEVLRTHDYLLMVDSLEEGLKKIRYYT
jgi:anti-anti-sigma factor